LGKDDFRHELNDAVDSIAGPPSPVMRDRVRSALVEATDRPRTFRLAGVAAALMALTVVGTFYIVSQNQNFVSARPLGHSSPSVPSSPQSPLPSPSPSVPTFMCTASTLSAQVPAKPVAYVTDVRTGAHGSPGYDRVTIEFSNGLPQSIEVRPQVGTTFMRGGSGALVTLRGRNGLLILMRGDLHGADAHTFYLGHAQNTKPNYPSLVEVRVLEDNEGVVQLGLGINGPACYSTAVYSNPTRIVIDIQVP
jgi:hypothetical protein